MPPNTPEWLSSPGNEVDDLARALRPVAPRRALALAALVACAALGATFFSSSTMASVAEPAAPEPKPEPAEQGKFPLPTAAPIAPPAVENASPVSPASSGRSAPRRSGRGHRLGLRHFRLPSHSGNSAAGILIRKGSYWLARGEPVPAADYFGRASHLASNNAEAWYGLALARHELLRPAAAQDAARRALLANPTHAMSNLLAGFIAQELGRYAVARVHYLRYLAAEPRGSYAPELQSVLSQLPEG